MDITNLIIPDTIAIILIIISILYLCRKMRREYIFDSPVTPVV